MEILLLCASFSFLFFGPSSSKPRTGHQTLQVARSCCPAVCSLPCLAPSRSPVLSKDLFEWRLRGTPHQESSRIGEGRAGSPFAVVRRYGTPPLCGMCGSN